MMKIVATINENESVNVQRFENELKVGERNIRCYDYCYAMMEQLPMSAIFEYLSNSNGPMGDYLKDLEEEGEFNKFFETILNSVSTDWYEDNSEFLRFLAVILRRTNKMNVDDPFVLDFLQAIIEQHDKLDINEQLATIMIGLLKKFLKQGPAEDSGLESKKNAIFKAILHSIQVEHREELKNVIQNVIPHVDEKWFSEMILNTQQKSDKKLHYFAGKIPPGVSYMGVNSQGVSYVYEVPKSRIRVKYHGASIDDVGHPRLLAIYKIGEDDKIISMKIVAVKEGEPINDNMQVFRYPFAHVFGGGNVCWYTYRTLTSDMLPHVANIFLSTDNSNHGRGNTFEIYKENEGKDFDDSKLEPFGLLNEVL
ncbi:hypothetical protein JOD29_000499 [Lysinibacillus composti]|uniref:Uncharacterized protein n=1 Tax=Lysinibacillus composti TaxID=720633 RepID=A0A3N9UJN2_9BACI|nr:hypothetical protein [Lysinibacillus composti]MBM7607262.1 hypothetical protein [Lysinibacillus composti]RQW76161.1 hypothetical protein EBB45_01020 [Lysinibacillus composti]